MAAIIAALIASQNWNSNYDDDEDYVPPPRRKKDSNKKNWGWPVTIGLVVLLGVILVVLSFI
jgi:hypothetical protein